MLGSLVIGESVNKNSLLVYVLRFFRILEDWCGKGERLGYERSRLEVRFHPGLRFSFVIKGTLSLSITGQKFSKRLKNGGDRLQKGQLR